MFELLQVWNLYDCKYVYKSDSFARGNGYTVIITIIINIIEILESIEFIKVFTYI